MAGTVTAPVPVLQLLNTEASHEVCCIDEKTTHGRITMCGLPIPDGEDLGGDVPTCVVCQDLLERWAHNADIYGEDPLCPDDPPCRACPRRAGDG